MAKKGQAVQLQTEVNTDEEWEELLLKDGLIVVDVYSEWCGPCSGMNANLKKLKLEIGGDLLQLAVAKSNHITVLERFRNKSEPTWMFIVDGKMVNLIFGANAPKLMRIIAQELKNETAARAGTRERETIEITELAPEERVRFEAAEAIAAENRRIEEEAKATALHERRLEVCNNLLETQAHVGVLVVFPHAKDQYVEVLADAYGEAGLILSTTEKIMMTEDQMEELLYFTDWRFSNASAKQLYNNECIAVTFKTTTEEMEETIENILLRIIYGPYKNPPGTPDSPAQQLTIVVDTTEEEEEGDEGTEGAEVAEGAETVNEEETATEASSGETGPIEYIGLWTPQNALTKAMCIKILFPKIYEPLATPEPEPTPPHLAMAYDAFKRPEVLEVIETYPMEVIRYGFFTDDNVETAELIAKTLPKFEKHLAQISTATEKIIVQVAKRKSECVLAFAQLGPSYMSVNTVEGEKDCKTLFPKDYDVPEEEEVVEVKKKSTKKKKKGATSKTDVEAGAEAAPSGEAIVEGAEGEEVAAAAEGEEEESPAAGETAEGEEVSEAPVESEIAPPALETAAEAPPPATEETPKVEEAPPAAPEEAPPAASEEAPPAAPEEADKATSPIEGEAAPAE